MPQIFPVYPLGQDTAGAVVIPGAERMYPYEPSPEVGYAHWLLGPDADSLAPYGGSATLTPQAAGHEWSVNYVTLPSYGNALITNIADAAVQTIYAVVRYQPIATKNVLLLGNLSGAIQGSGLWLSSSGAIQTIVRTDGAPAFVNHGVPDGVAVGDWIFVGLAVWVDAGNAVSRTIICDDIYEFAWSAAKGVSGVNRPMLGSAYLATSNYTPAPVSVAELIIRAAGADSAAQMLRVYGRSRARMAARGIELA